MQEHHSTEQLEVIEQTTASIGPRREATVEGERRELWGKTVSI